MKYCLQDALDRTKEITLNENRTGVLVRCNYFGHLDLPSVPSLETCQFPQDANRLMDAVIERHLRWFDAHRCLDDDYIPALKPFLGIAEHSCFMGGEVKYGGNTSYQLPALDDINDWHQLRLDENKPHYRLLLDCMAHLKEKSKAEGFFVSLRGFDGPMDIANAIRGNDILFDLYDDAETTKDFIDFCADACLWTSNNQRRYADEVDGGYISGMGNWMPGNSIGHLSEDMSALCSPQTYEEFGLPYMKKVLDNFDYATLHVHSLGRYCIPYFRKLEKVKVIQLSDDPNQPSAMDVFKEYSAYLNNVIIMLDLNAQSVRENLSFLKQHRVIVNLSANSISEAQETIELLRS